MLPGVHLSSRVDRYLKSTTVIKFTCMTLSEHQVIYKPAIIYAVTCHFDLARLMHYFICTSRTCMQCFFLLTVSSHQCTVDALLVLRNVLLCILSLMFMMLMKCALTQHDWKCHPDATKEAECRTLLAPGPLGGTENQGHWTETFNPQTCK